MFCKDINLMCLCLWDFDKVVKFNKIICVIKRFLGIDKVFKKIYNREYCYKEFLLFIIKDDLLKVVKLLEKNINMFIWRYGVIEDVIFSFNECNIEICKFFKWKIKINFINLKDKFII